MKIHIVQKGDTLWKLSKKYGVSFEELKKANAQLSNPDMMMPGMKIKVPGSSGSVKKETVKPSVKEAPTQYTQPVKEQPMAPQPFVQQPIVKEQPKPEPFIQQPMAKEEPFPKHIVKEQPLMPEIDMEIDINNYYMVNMVKPPAPKMVEPKEMKEESPELEYAPAPDCVPITPIMPGTGFCLPYQPWAIPQMQQSFPQGQEWESCSDTSEMQYMQQQGYGAGFYPYRQERTTDHQYDSSSFDQAGYGQFYGNNPAMGGSYVPEIPTYESSMESPAHFMSMYNKHQHYPKFQPQFQQPEYQHYPEAQPPYQQSPDSQQYPMVQSQYQQPEYDHYPEVQTQYQQYPERQQYPEIQPQYQQYPESKEYPKVQPQYQQPEYD
ncbi:SafA/ExsA family spore coat assembly protein, partial [Bacillus sp. V59.32b]|uniref:SafA/ExsA family spore coat assembly protein n=1 Tax=Bacillus sp. V59.32b TaxID=1758642 RepID=UPI000E3C8599